MKRILRYLPLLTVGIFLQVQTPGNAETISSKEAKALAQKFFNEASGRVVAPVKMVYNGRRLTTDRLFIPFYIYNNPAGGFVIISAENKTFPILGYSLKDNFDADGMGPITKALLSSYAHEIEMIRYDSTFPVEAEKAWVDYPAYVRNLLDARYEATDPGITSEEAARVLGMVARSEDADISVSQIYTPAQWQEMVDADLRAHENLPIGFIDSQGLYAAVIHGKKGDYYRMMLDGRNSWLMRINASEIISGRMLANFDYWLDFEDEIPEEPAFASLDSFADETAEIESARVSRNYLTPAIEEPIVFSLGGGHYEIRMPENAEILTVYNIGGSRVMRNTYSDTMTLNLDLSAEPTGFYFALIGGESGKPYGVKIVR